MSVQHVRGGGGGGDNDGGDVWCKKEEVNESNTINNWPLNVS